MYSSLFRIPVPRAGLPWMVLGFQGDPSGPGQRSAFNRFARDFGDHTSGIVAEDPADHFRFGRDDFAVAGGRRTMCVARVTL